MPNVTGTTRAQTLFLRAFRTSPTGPAPADWPTPAILRKWLRKPAFRRALATIQETLHFQSDFQLASAATTAARKLLTDDAHLTTHDLGRLLRLAHLRHRFAPADPDAPSTPNDHRDNQDTDEDDDPAFAGITAAAIAASKANPANKFMTPGCTACIIRQRNADWIEDPARFKKLAFENGYTSPLREWPDFPPPVPQDTFYYQLIQDPAALLRYMQCYDRLGNDHRFQPILLQCGVLLHHIEDGLPQFASQRPNPIPSPGTPGEG
jgi:hypothetical protein